MKPEYDCILIGAGPTGYATLKPLAGSGLKCMVVTGCGNIFANVQHAKIRSVAYERERPAGIAEVCSTDNGSEVFASAEIGGLANFWGQQIQIYNEADPWQQSGTFGNWARYRATCLEILSEFECSGGTTLGTFGSMSVEAPRLMRGTQDSPGSELSAIAHATTQVFEQAENINRLDGRVCRLEHYAGGIVVALEDGRRISGKRVILASGLVGTAGIIIRSLDTVQSAEFRDHVPYLLYTLGLGRHLPQHDTTHFNEYSLLLRGVEENCDQFATVYAMSKAPVSLLAASLRMQPTGRGYKPPRLIDIVRPVQLWTNATVAKLRYDPRGLVIDAEQTCHAQDDADLKSFRAVLNSHRVPHTVGSTAPGQGFHYHALSFEQKGSPPTDLDDLLRTAFGDQVICVDTSALRQVGCAPPTLTAMSHARARVAGWVGAAAARAGSAK